MLVEPNLDVMLHDKRVGNKFALVTLTLKRARQLNDGSGPLVVTTAKKPVSIALYEIYADQVKVMAKPEGESVQEFPSEAHAAGVVEAPTQPAAPPAEAPLVSLEAEA